MPYLQQCTRCGLHFSPEDGCECQDLTDEELRAKQGEPDYDDMHDPDDDASDRAADAWERYHHGDR